MRLEPQRTSRVAIAALYELERRRHAGLTKRAELADRCGTTIHLLPRILAPMVREGWILSSAGPRGGYRLGDVEGVSMLDVIETMEGPVYDGDCPVTGIGCDPVRPCDLHDAWDDTCRAFRAALGEMLVLRGST